MLSIFDQLYNFIFPKNKNKLDFKLGDVIYLFARNDASQKTRAIIKIYGKQGFIVCDSNFYPINRKKKAIKLISRQYRRKYNLKLGYIWYMDRQNGSGKSLKSQRFFVSES